MIPNLRKRFTAYVVFQGADHRRWWRIYTRRGWRHCYLIVPAHQPGANLFAKPGSIVVNPWVSYLRIDYLPETPAAICKRMIEEGATCAIELPVDQKFSGAYVPRGLMTCVSLIKAAIGCNAWHVWTPEQLARWMLQHGGKMVEPNS